MHWPAEFAGCKKEYGIQANLTELLVDSGDCIE